MTFFWHSAWDEKMGETLSSAEYFQPGEQMVGWCFMLLVELYLLVYPRVNSIPPIKVKHQHETNGWAWIFDFWINQLISEHVFFFKWGSAYLWDQSIDWKEELLSHWEILKNHPIIPSHDDIVKGCFPLTIFLRWCGSCNSICWCICIICIFKQKILKNMNIILYLSVYIYILF